jgi:hypothetical protein
VMAAELRTVTPKPVRYVVNTHWHDDHHSGNAVYLELWPDVQFIAHRDTRIDIIEKTYGAGQKRSTTPWRRRRVTSDGLRPARSPTVSRAMSGAVNGWRRSRPTSPLTIGSSCIAADKRSRFAGSDRQRTRRHGCRLAEGADRGVRRSGRLSDPVHVRVVSRGLAEDARRARFTSGRPAVSRTWPGNPRSHISPSGPRAAAGAPRSREGRRGPRDARADAAASHPRRLEGAFAGDDATKQHAFDGFVVQPGVERVWRQARGEPDK